MIRTITVMRLWPYGPLPLSQSFFKARFNFISGDSYTLSLMLFLCSINNIKLFFFSFDNPGTDRIDIYNFYKQMIFSLLYCSYIQLQLYTNGDENTFFFLLFFFRSSVARYYGRKFHFFSFIFFTAKKERILTFLCWLIGFPPVTER